VTGSETQASDRVHPFGNFYKIDRLSVLTWLPKQLILCRSQQRLCPLDLIHCTAFAEDIAMERKQTSYLLWLTIFLGFGGLHRLYNGKIATGVLWFFTWGLFGVGQVVDLLLIPDMVDEHELRRRMKYGLLYDPAQPAVTRTLEPAELATPQAPLRIQLLKAAQARGGKLSVTQGVVDTGADFADVEAELMAMAKKGYAGIQNDPTTGVVLYDFHEL
jgi:TM2 domain-containing membrane protein YozV